MQSKLPDSGRAGAARKLAGAISIVALTPFRSRRLAKKYSGFREEHQAGHDAIYSHFNHCDALVDGIGWHYVDGGPRDGPPNDISPGQGMRARTRGREGRPHFVYAEGEMQPVPARSEAGEGSLHPRPEGRNIRDPPHSQCNKQD
jgi:hypothetical protein